MRPWVLATLLAIPLPAQRQLADLNPLIAAPSSAPSSFAELGTQVLFAATAPAVGRELMIGNPTVPSVAVLADLAPGPLGSAPRELTRVGSQVFFFADDGGGEALWRSDGTGAGTRKLRFMSPHVQGYETRPIHAVGAIAFVFGDDGLAGRELWRSDGTVAGTVLVKDMEAGSAGGWPSAPTVVGSVLVYAWNAPWPAATRTDLMVSDGTVAGTRVITSSLSGGPYVYSTNMGVIGNRVYFGASLPTPFEVKLWTSDLTTVGTAVLLPQGPTSPNGFVSNGASIYFAENNGTAQPWISDGTLSGSRPVAGLARAHAVVALGTTWFGLGIDSVFSMTQRGLFRVNNAVATFLGPRLASRELSIYPDMVAANGRVYFRAIEESRVGETHNLWTSDGTSLGTREVLDLAPGEYEADLANLTAFGSGVVFSCDDGFLGTEPWFSNGMAAGTRPLADVLPGVGGGVGSKPQSFVDLPGATLFQADGAGLGSELWRTDGSAVGTSLVANLTFLGSSTLSDGVRIGSRAFYRYSGSGSKILTTDGTAVGTRLLELSSTYPVTSLTASSDRVAHTFIRINTGSNTVNQIVKLGDGSTTYVSIPAGSSAPTFGFTVEDRVYFTYDAGGTGRELWSESGLVRDIQPGPGSSDPGMTLRLGWNGLLLFSAIDANGGELWRSDGTSAGTTLVSDISPGPASSTPREGRVTDRGVFFVADHPSFGTELWITDGTPAGTSVLEAIPGPLGGEPQTLVAQHGGVYFSAKDQFGDRELWFSDGTQAGTRLVANLAASGSSTPVVLAAVGSRRIFFTADDGVNGRELWQSDGTLTGTRMVGPIAPGLTDPQVTTLFVRGDGILIFPADDGVTGPEPYLLDAGAVSRVVGSSCGTTVLPRLVVSDPVLGGNSRVEVLSRAAANFGGFLLGMPGYSPIGPSCRVHLDLTGPVVAIPIPIVAGSFVGTLPVPNAPALLGGVVNTQVVAGPTPTIPLNLDVSNAVALRLGH